MQRNNGNSPKCMKRTSQLSKEQMPFLVDIKNKLQRLFKEIPEIPQNNVERIIRMESKRDKTCGQKEYIKELTQRIPGNSSK